MYTIEMTYQTGNSYGSHEETDVIGHCWEDFKLANKALAAVKEHYDLYQALDGWFTEKTKDEVWEEVQTKDWYENISNGEYRDYQCKNNWYECIAFEMDDGTWKNCSTNMWIGYFESLKSIKIVVPDMGYTF